jgi:hypothetical protein
VAAQVFFVCTLSISISRFLFTEDRRCAPKGCVNNINCAIIRFCPSTYIIILSSRCNNLINFLSNNIVLLIKGAYYFLCKSIVLCARLAFFSFVLVLYFIFLNENSRNASHICLVVHTCSFRNFARRHAAHVPMFFFL